MERISNMKDASGSNICFNCQKACGGCSWTEINPETNKPRFEPVPGWTAKPVLLNVGRGTKKGGIIDKCLQETYHITACPEFVPDAPRESSGGELDEFQFKVLLRKWRIWGFLK